MLNEIVYMNLPNGGSTIFGKVLEEKLEKNKWKYVKVKWFVTGSSEEPEEASWIRYDRLRILKTETLKQIFSVVNDKEKFSS